MGTSELIVARGGERAGGKSLQVQVTRDGQNPICLRSKQMPAV